MEAEGEELTSKGLIVIDAEGEERSGTNTWCAKYKRISSNGALGSKKRRRIETAKEYWKNMFNLTYV